MLLTATQVSRLCKAFATNSSTNTKFSKTQMYKAVQSEGFLPFGPQRIANPKSSMNPIENLVPKSLKDSLKHSFEEEANNKGLPKSKKDLRHLLVNPELNTLSKKVNKGLSLITGLALTKQWDKIH